jgi:DNA-binding MarR family transcriptional regulator
MGLSQVGRPGRRGVGGGVTQDRVPPPAGAVAIVIAAERFVTAAVTPVLAAQGVSGAQWRVLVLLDEGAGATMGEVAASAGVAGPTATRLADRLVAEGLARRRVDQWDRRRVLVHLSPAGRAIVERVSAALEDSLGEALARCEDELPDGAQAVVLAFLHGLTASVAGEALRGGAGSGAAS